MAQPYVVRRIGPGGKFNEALFEEILNQQASDNYWLDRTFVIVEELFAVFRHDETGDKQKVKTGSEFKGYGPQ